MEKRGRVNETELGMKLRHYTHVGVECTPPLTPPCRHTQPNTIPSSHRIVAQDTKNPLLFSIVERFERVESQEVEHIQNPYWKTFNPAVEPWLAKPIDIKFVNEL